MSGKHCGLLDRRCRVQAGHWEFHWITRRRTYFEANARRELYKYPEPRFNIQAIFCTHITMAAYHKIWRHIHQMNVCIKKFNSRLHVCIKSEYICGIDKKAKVKTFNARCFSHLISILFFNTKIEQTRIVLYHLFTETVKKLIQCVVWAETKNYYVQWQENFKLQIFLGEKRKIFCQGPGLSQQ